MSKIAFLNGEYLPLDKAKIHISDLGLTRAYAVFDFFRFFKGIPLHLDLHLERLEHSCKRMGIDIEGGTASLAPLVDELIRRNPIDKGGIKIIVTGGYSENAYTPTTPNIFGNVIPIPAPPAKWYETGIKVKTLEFQRELTDVKTTNYTVPIMILGDLKKAGAQEVLYHLNGFVTESARSNFFIVKENVLITPKDNVLHGITRHNVLKLAREFINVELREVTLTEIRHADEAFLSSSSKRILGITQVDDKFVGAGEVGPVTKKLAALLEDYEKSLLLQHS